MAINHQGLQDPTGYLTAMFYQDKEGVLPQPPGKCNILPRKKAADFFPLDNTNFVHNIENITNNFNSVRNNIECNANYQHPGSNEDGTSPMKSSCTVFIQNTYNFIQNLYNICSDV